MAASGPTIVFASCSSLRREDAAAGWLYLGKGDRLDALTARLGSRPAPLGDRLHIQAKRLRRPFLDLVAALGKPHGWSASWWAGTLAWKDPAASDLFLLCCYQALCAELAAEGRPLAVAVEDPWLLAQLSRDFRDRGDVSFRGLQPLALEKLAAAATGAARRIKWAIRMMVSRSRQRGASLPPESPEKRVLLYSHVLPRSLENAGWSDHYLTGLEEELAAAGYSVFRATDPDVSGYEAALARRSSVLPPILHGSPLGFLRALTSLPPPVRNAELSGRQIGLLLEREWWHDASRAGRCAYLFMRDCLDRLFSRTRFDAVVFPWENQPQERMLLLAAKHAGVRAVGYQHTTIPELMLHFFPGRGEADWAPLPDALMTSGAYPLEKLRAEGMPAKILRLGGSRRYQPPPRAAVAAGTDVLALLSIDEAQSRRLLAALKRAADGHGLVIKPHPALPLSPEQAGGARIARGSLAEALAGCGAVVFAGTTSGIEAWLGGHPVLRFRAEALLDVDPCDALSDSELPTADDWDLAERLASVRANPAPPSATARRALESFFAPVDRPAWLSAIAERPR